MVGPRVVHLRRQHQVKPLREALLEEHGHDPAGVHLAAHAPRVEHVVVPDRGLRLPLPPVPHEVGRQVNLLAHLVPVRQRQ